MARYRLSEPAKADIAAILKTSERRHGAQARIRYRALLTAAMRRVAAEPDGVLTATHDELLDGIRSFHILRSALAEFNDTIDGRGDEELPEVEAELVEADD
jgi:toxin ParE1/3/4